MEIHFSKKLIVAPLEWGIIGPGKIAHDFARDLALVQPQQKITAVLGRNQSSADNFVKEFATGKAYADQASFLQHPGLNIVYIATPHPAHYEQAMACLQNKIPVLCEKPLAVNAEQAAGLINASRENNCFLMEAMWIRFLPGIIKALEIVKQGTIGKILSVKASMGYKAPKDENSRYFDPELGGGSLLDLGIYPVFLAHLLLGKPRIIKAIGTLTEKGIDESCSVLLDYDGSAQAILDSTLVSQSDRPAEVAGSKGIINILNPWFEKSPAVEWQLYNQEKQQFVTDWEGHGLQFEIMEVLHCLENKQIESTLFPHRLSLDITETMDAIREQIHVVYKEDN
ncbi:MAG: Gfo/Idh/MocA family oxidoreductase [Chitinophagaceae bacterium]